MLNDVITWLDQPAVRSTVVVVFILLILLIIVRYTLRFLTRKISDNRTRYTTRKYITVSAYFAAVLVILAFLSGSLGNLGLTIGMIGAGLAFALQEVVISIAGWFTISTSKIFNTGDRVELGGIKGDVIDISLLRTTVMQIGDWVKGDLYNGRVVRVSNSVIFREPVYNYSGEFPFLWDEIEIPVKYGSDYIRAQEIIENVLRDVTGEYSSIAAEAWKDLVARYMIEEARVTPMVSMHADADWVTFTARYVVDYKMRRSTKSALFNAIVRALELDDHTSIATASSELALTSIPPLDVRNQNS